MTIRTILPEHKLSCRFKGKRGFQRKIMKNHSKRLKSNCRKYSQGTVLTNFGKITERIHGHIKENVHGGKQEATSVELSKSSSKIYLKALPLRSLSDVNMIKHEIKAGNILILRVRPLATKSVEDVKQAVNELCEFTQEVGGDIARLGEERVVITPSSVRIWRERLPSSEEKPAAKP